jgi:hypothetical protein
MGTGEESDRHVAEAYLYENQLIAWCVTLMVANKEVTGLQLIYLS